jgi:hypothetical protein
VIIDKQGRIFGKWNIIDFYYSGANLLFIAHSYIWLEII